MFASGSIKKNKKMRKSRSCSNFSQSTSVSKDRISVKSKNLSRRKMHSKQAFKSDTQKSTSESPVPTSDSPHQIGIASKFSGRMFISKIDTNKPIESFRQELNSCPLSGKEVRDGCDQIGSNVHETNYSSPLIEGVKVPSRRSLGISSSTVLYLSLLTLFVAFLSNMSIDELSQFYVKRQIEHSIKKMELKVLETQHAKTYQEDDAPIYLISPEGTQSGHADKWW